MGIESIIGGIITILLVVVPFVFKRLGDRQEVRNLQQQGVAQVEYDETKRARELLNTPDDRVQPLQ